jgi:ABC-type dipeptide/oligopeptide/nickel transport system permease component
MTRFILKRIGQAIIILFLMSTLVFALTRLSGNPASLYVPENASRDTVIAMEKYLGLDKPIIEQYGVYLLHLLKGDFGNSVRYRLPALKLFLQRVPPTLELCGLAFLLSLIFGFIAGILAAVNRKIDSFVMILTLLGQAIPPFVAALLLIYFIALKFGILPTSGYGGIAHAILPAIALSMFFVAAIARLLRGSMLETLGKDYIRLARIKGVKERVVILKHALKNSIIPVITYVGPLSVVLVTAALAVEVVFGWPGIGEQAYTATIGLDFPLIQTAVLILAAALIFVNLIVDILYAWIDPRIRLW